MDPEANYQEGKILFGNFFDQNGAQPDVVKSPFTEDAWDFQEGSPGLSGSIVFFLSTFLIFPIGYFFSMGLMAAIYGILIKKINTNY